MTMNKNNHEENSPKFNALLRSLASIIHILNELTTATQGASPNGPNHRRQLDEYQDFDFDSINAYVVAIDQDGPTILEFGGYRYIRRSKGQSGKFAPAIWYSRALTPEKDPPYTRLITFSSFGVDRLAFPAPAPTTKKPVPQRNAKPRPIDPLDRLDKEDAQDHPEAYSPPMSESKAVESVSPPAKAQPSPAKQNGSDPTAANSKDDDDHRGEFYSLLKTLMGKDGRMTSDEANHYISIGTHKGFNVALMDLKEYDAGIPF